MARELLVRYDRSVLRRLCMVAAIKKLLCMRYRAQGSRALVMFADTIVQEPVFYWKYPDVVTRCNLRREIK